MIVYLDNSATTKVRDEVIEQMVNIFSVNYGNPSSLHRMGLDVEKKIENARKQIASFINCNSSEIIFTSGGTESNNLAINNYVSKLNKSNTNIVTTSIEHSSVFNVFKELENKGYEVRLINTDEYGKIDTDNFRSLVDEYTGFISIVHVNNEIGTIQDIQELVKISKEKNKSVKIHLDSIQGLGKVRIDTKKMLVDSISFSSHKIHGPKGVGALYVRNSNYFEPIMYGGGQENGKRPGTENTPGIVGFGLACELINKDFDKEIRKLQSLKEKYTALIAEKIDDVRINSLYNEFGAPHILSVSFKDVKAEVLLHYLEGFGIYVSTGAACSSKIKGNRILKAISLDNNYAEGTIRISFGHFNDENEIEYVVDKLKKSVEDIRKIIR